MGQAPSTRFHLAAMHRALGQRRRGERPVVGRLGVLDDGAPSRRAVVLHPHGQSRRIAPRCPPAWAADSPAAATGAVTLRAASIAMTSSRRWRCWSSASTTKLFTRAAKARTRCRSRRSSSVRWRAHRTAPRRRRLGPERQRTCDGAAREAPGQPSRTPCRRRRWSRAAPPGSPTTWPRATGAFGRCAQRIDHVGQRRRRRRCVAAPPRRSGSDWLRFARRGLDLAGGPGDLGGQRTGMRGALGRDHRQRGGDLRRIADGRGGGAGERTVVPGLV